jgi:hypothetical protein
MTLPPDLHAVRWYCEHRIRSLSGYTLQQAAMNDVLWRTICERGLEGGLKLLEADQDAVVNTEAYIDPCVNVQPPTPRDRHTPGYMRDYMRKRRAAPA